MFGIDDPGIFMAYLLAVACIVFAVWFGITRWNKNDDEDMNLPKKRKS